MELIVFGRGFAVRGSRFGSFASRTIWVKVAALGLDGAFSPRCIAGLRRTANREPRTAALDFHLPLNHIRSNDDVSVSGERALHGEGHSQSLPLDLRQPSPLPGKVGP